MVQYTIRCKGWDGGHFSRFAQSLLPTMFQQHPRIVFECDDCDPAAMLLKNLFVNQSDTGFCTYIYE